MMTLVEALRLMRNGPHHAQYAELLCDAYLDVEAEEAAERFHRSAEFAAVTALLSKILGKRMHDCNILDLGAGTGIAAYAFARNGARRVYALEPDASGELGCAAIRCATARLGVQIIESCGENIPLADATIDIVYARQVLHHAGDLLQLLRECARVLLPGGVLLACREHVVDDKRQLREFLASHPVHRLAGGEHAFPLKTYLEAIRRSGLIIKQVMHPWDTVINAYPMVRSAAELERLPQTLLEKHLGYFGRLACSLPGANRLVKRLIKRRLRRRREPGRMYSFLAAKP